MGDANEITTISNQSFSGYSTDFKAVETTLHAVTGSSSTSQNSITEATAPPAYTELDFSANSTYGYKDIDVYDNGDSYYDSYGYLYDGEYDYGDEFMYPGYDFERDLYLYIWEILVIFIFLVNLLVISVLLRRKMRNSTNIILAAIAISDSLTGLVTLPTYIMVYQRYDPLMHVSEYGQYDYHSHNTSNSSFLPDDHHQNGNHLNSNGYHLLFNMSGLDGISNSTNASQTTEYLDYQSYINDPSMFEDVDGYILTKGLCRGFMFTKYFLSKSFHTVSIFLTLFLAIQRYVSVAFPYKSQFMFNTRRTIICCVIIFLLSPILHTYHLASEKAVDGLCQWGIREFGCGGTCIYLWIAFFVRHFLPCVTLIVLSALFISHLHVGEKSLRRMDSNSSQISRRTKENRRISIIVMAIVVVFLIPEIPYGIFLLYNAIEKTANDGEGIKLRTNRAIQLAYEVALILSFHANFYVYILFNRRFRKVLYRMLVKPVRRVIGDPRRLSITRTSSTSHAGSSRKAAFASTKTEQESRWLHTIDSEKSTGSDAKTLHTFTSEKSQIERELEPLDVKL